MKLDLTIADKQWSADLSTPFNLAVPMDFDGPQPQIHGIAPAKRVIRADTRLGASVNWEELQLTPHSHGTHSESIGHITKERYPLPHCLQDSLIPTRVISVTSSDGIIPGDAIPDGIDTPALVVRSLPNCGSKRHKDYSAQEPPYFSREAMEKIVQSGVRHLLVDLPSLDKADDGGALSCHCLFWAVDPSTRQPTDPKRIDCTVTEMIFVPDEVPDGYYLLNLQVAELLTDAVPSRPILYPLYAHE